MASVDLNELIGQIVHDASFESQKRDVVVTLKAGEQFVVRENAELLHSAIENVIRSAIHYIAIGTSVDVAPRGREANGASFVSLTVRDCESGVSSADQISIFQPFYRAAQAAIERRAELDSALP